MRTSALYFLRNHRCNHNNFCEMVSYTNYTNHLHSVKFNKHKYHSYYPIAEIRFKFFAMKYPFQLQNLDYENRQIVERLLNSDYNNKEMEMYDSDDIDYFNLTTGDNNDPINFTNQKNNHLIPSRRHRNRLYLASHNFFSEEYAEKCNYNIPVKTNVVIMEKIKLGSFMSELENRVDTLLKKHKIKSTSECVSINSSPRLYNSSDEQLIHTLLSLNPLMFSETSFYGSYSLQSKLNIVYHLYNQKLLK